VGWNDRARGRALDVAFTPQAQAGAPSFGFVSLEVGDMARARAFYVDALGMKPVYTISKPTDPFEKIAFNFSGDARSSEPLLILIHYAHPTLVQNRSSGAKLGIRVTDSRAAAERVRAAGFPIVHEAAADAKGPVINSIVRDADGVIVERVELHMP
jgi:catechol 2,3-dioxygenase-like lactoylglutathione lyase family enzyme